MQEILTAQVVINFAASALGALGAGYVGVRFGLYRLRRERGFDQRLAWYKEMLGALHDAAKLIDELRETSPDLRDVVRTDPTAALRVRRFDLALAEARAYATQRSIAALNRTAQSFVQLGEGEIETQTDFNTALEAMLQASEALSDEVRTHLGLEKVSESVWPFERLRPSS
jgi:hypothetical protein